MEYTVIEGYPAPDSWDLADGPSDIFAFASAQDAKFPGWDAALLAGQKQKTFRFSMSANSSAVAPLNAIPLAFNTTDFNNTGSALASNTWAQPSGDGPSWWYFGGMIYVVAAATPGIGHMQSVALLVSDLNTDTNQSISYYGCYGDSTESNTGGEFINWQGILKLYGSAHMNLYFASSGTTNATVQAGSMWWGTRLGSA